MFLIFLRYIPGFLCVDTFVPVRPVRAKAQQYAIPFEKLISRFRKPKAVSKDNKPTLAHKLWEKYGIVGLGFLGTFTVGAPVSIAVGVGFNVNMHKLASWCCIGVLARCAVFTLVGHFGMKLF